MSKGREAVRAARRREQEAREEAEQLRSRLSAARADHKKEADALREEIRKLHAGRTAEASRLASEEVIRLMAEKEDERKRLGLSVDVAKNALYLKDRFVLNACKYISMTTGIRPENALQLVIPWMTDEDFEGVKNPAALIAKLGVPTDGWVARMMNRLRHHYRVQMRSLARSGRVFGTLDGADQEGGWLEKEIDPRYDPNWYPAKVAYRDMALVEEAPAESHN